MSEKWLSGRKRQIANLLYEFSCHTEGSNPSFSVNFYSYSFKKNIKEKNPTQHMSRRKKYSINLRQQHLLKYQQAIKEDAPLFLCQTSASLS